MDQRLIEAIEQVVNWLEAGGQFVSSQAPAVVTEIVLYGRVKETLMAVVGIFILFSLLKAVPKFQDAWIDEDEDGLLFWGMYGCLAFVFGLSWTLHYGDGAFMVWLAPRLYVLEYFSSLTR